MSSRWFRGALMALSVLSLPLLTGCETKTVVIQLPGFGDGSIDGIWLWRQNDSGQWQRYCRIDFEDRRMTESGETLWYVQNCVLGATKRAIVLPSVIERAPGDPGTITLEMLYLRYEPPGVYRATAFNEAGESVLSSTSVPL